MLKTGWEHAESKCNFCFKITLSNYISLADCAFCDQPVHVHRLVRGCAVRMCCKAYLVMTLFIRINDRQTAVAIGSQALDKNIRLRNRFIHEILNELRLTDVRRIFVKTACMPKNYNLCA